MEYYQDGFVDGESQGETRSKKKGQLQIMIFLVVWKLRKGKVQGRLQTNE